MTERESRTDRARRLAREQALYRYSSALERGDFATVAAVLRQAVHDPALAGMIHEVNAALQGEPESPGRPVPLPLSANGHARAVPPRVPLQVVNQEQSTMTANTTSFPKTRSISFTALAAALAVILFAGLLILGGGGGGIAPGAAPGGDNGSGGGLMQAATATPTATQTHIPVITATFTATPFIGAPPEGAVFPPGIMPTMLPMTATPIPAGGGSGGGMILPPGGDPGFGIPGLLLSVGAGTTTLHLPSGENVAGFVYTAEQDEVLLLTLTASGFTPWLHVAALDDAVPGGGINAASPPLENPAVYSLNAGDRLLILVGSTNRALTGEFTLTLQPTQPLDLLPAQVQLDEENNEATMTFTAPGAGFYHFLPYLLLEDASAEALSFGRLHLAIAQGEQWLVSADFNFPTETDSEAPRHPLGITPGEAGDVTITLRADVPDGATFALRFTGVVFTEGGSIQTSQ